ncbi:hypothetical protein PENTCL1PPCAC_29425, partial [Pristionchus entomophagus]
SEAVPGKPRFDYEKIRHELDAAMLLCVPSVDQYQRVMYTIIQLLYKEIEGVEMAKQFNVSATLSAALEALESCEKPKDDRETVLLTFARSFVLFMQYLGGFKLHNCHQSLAQAHVGCTPHKRPRPSNGIPSNEAAPNPNSSPSSQAAEGQTTVKKVRNGKKAKEKQRVVPIKEGPIKVGWRFDIDGNLRYDGDPIKGFEEEERAIKEEEPDPDEGASTDLGAMNPTTLPLFDPIEPTEIKDEVKEEPLEEIMADTIRFASVPSTSNQIAVPRNYPHITQQQIIANQKALMRKTYCPFCKNKALPACKLEDHVRNNHKDDWIKFVKKCPEIACDFRSQNISDINDHRSKVHTPAYYKWKDTCRFVFISPYRCLFCTHKINNMAQFIDHMEVYHPR